MGEDIIDARDMSEAEILELFDNENDYLNEWKKEQKMKLIRSYMADHTLENSAYFKCTSLYFSIDKLFFI